MATRGICYYGHSILRTKAKPITEITDAVRQLAKDMADTLHETGGLGLAANQVGAAVRLFVMELEENEKIKCYTIANPVLTQKSKQTEINEEGCLSFPDIYGPIERHTEIVLEGMTLDGQSLRLEASGILGRVIQHELDHLNGMLFIDRMSMTHQLILSKKLKELVKKTKNSLVIDKKYA